MPPLPPFTHKYKSIQQWIQMWTWQSVVIGPIYHSYPPPPLVPLFLKKATVIISLLAPVWCLPSSSIENKCASVLFIRLQSNKTACDSGRFNHVCQLKCVGKTACTNPVSTGHSHTGLRVSGMLTAFWTAHTLLWQAKSYYPTWDSPVALLRPSNMLSFKCVSACTSVCLKAGWEGHRAIQ